MHPLISDRLITGHFNVKHPRLQQYAEKFFNYYSISKPSFEELLCKIKASLLRKNTDMRMAIPPEEMLALSLRQVDLHEFK